MCLPLLQDTVVTVWPFWFPFNKHARFGLQSTSPGATLQTRCFSVTPGLKYWAFGVSAQSIAGSALLPLLYAPKTCSYCYIIYFKNSTFTGSPVFYFTTLYRVTSKVKCLVPCKVHMSDSRAQCQQRTGEIGFLSSLALKPGDMKKAATGSPGHPGAEFSLLASLQQSDFGMRLAIWRSPGWKRVGSQMLMLTVYVWGTVGKET